MAKHTTKHATASRSAATVVFLAGCILLLSRAQAREAPQWRVLPFEMPDIAPLQADAVTERKVEILIASLAEIDKPDIGFSPTLSGADFPPVAGAARRGCQLITQHVIERKDAVTRLVRLGPAALPALLKHLGDATPTKLTMTHRSGIGGMWYSSELPTNAALEEETRLRDDAGLRTGPQDLSSHSDDYTDTHVVTVGDVCFVIVGMITNRAYETVRYQPSSCIVVNSPIREPRLGAAVRKMWSSGDARRELYSRLMRDFHTRGRGSGRIQAGAAMRLLYYFPKETARLVAERLRKLDVKTPPRKSGGEVIARFKRNGVPESTLIEAVAWCREPRVVQELRNIAAVSNDSDIVASASPAMVGDGEAWFLAKLRRIFEEESRKYPYANSTSCDLLKAIAAIYPEKIETVCREYVAAGEQTIAVNLLMFCRMGRADLAPSVLAPLLDDTNESGYREVARGESTNITLRLPVRICDRAHFVISRSLGDGEARISGTIEEMDARIAELKRRLRARE